MYARRFALIAFIVAMLVLNTLFSTWLLSGKVFDVAWAGPLNQNGAAAPVAAIPTAFSYQGTLRDANGNLINGTVNLGLRLYGDVTGGTALYTEEFTNVNVRDGLFNVVVGDAQALPASVFDTYPLFIGISVNDDAELLPRQRLHPVPYAMQASSAQSAVTAGNLTPGGGVPNLVTLGSGGASEIDFLPNNGKIANDANGLTLDGGADSRVATTGNLAVGGNLTVDGSWNAGAIHDVGNSKGGNIERFTYPVNISRYVVEAPDAGTAPDTVPIDNALLTEFCQDEDGCQVSLYMRNWAPANAPGLLAGVGPFRMALAVAANGKQQWSVYDNSSGIGTIGTDNDGAVTHLMNIYNTCFFTDGEHVNGGGSDGAPGFGLLNWFGAYDSTNMTCVLIIED